MVAAGRASIPRAAEVTIDPVVLAVTLGVSLLVGVLFGFAPHDDLKAAGGRAAGSVTSNRFRSALVASELALVLMLLIGTGLMIRAFWKLGEVHPGFEAQGLLTLRVNLPQATYPKPEQVDQFWQAIQQKINALPGVRSASLTNGLPPERPINANDTYIEGRGLDARDGAGGALTTVINQTMARVYYANQSPIGRRINPEGGPDKPETYRTIVGVVEDLKNAGLDQPAGSEAFSPPISETSRGARFISWCEASGIRGR
jgi:hypothetical protein